MSRPDDPRQAVVCARAGASRAARCVPRGRRYYGLVMPKISESLPLTFVAAFGICFALELLFFGLSAAGIGIAIAVAIGVTGGTWLRR